MQKSIGVCEADLAAPHRRDPVEDLDAGRHADDHRRDHEERVRRRRHPDGEHVMRPHAEADEPDRDGGADHRGVAEHRLAREDRDDLGREAEAGQHQHVDLGVAEDPEEVLPQHRRAAGLRVEEVRAEIAVEQQHDLRGRQRGDDDQHHAGRHEVEPDDERHAAERHAGAAHAQGGGDDVDRRADAADARRRGARWSSSRCCGPSRTPWP